ncbi:hypothetical protein OSTOST_03154 [Ostertagia ostertagi]
MFLLLTALCFLLVGVTEAGPVQWRMPPSVKRMYTGYMATNNPHLVWNDTMSKMAFDWVSTPDRPTGNYFLIDAAGQFPPAWPRTSVEQKVLRVLYGGFSRWWIKIKGLDRGTPYGCNHFYTLYYMHVLCIFQIL